MSIVQAAALLCLVSLARASTPSGLDHLGGPSIPLTDEIVGEDVVVPMEQPALVQEGVDVPQTVFEQTKYDTGEHYRVAEQVRLDGYDITQATVKTKGGTIDYQTALTLCGDYYGGEVPISDSFKTGNSEQARDAAKSSFLKGAWRCITEDPKDPKRFFDGAGDFSLAVTGWINKALDGLPGGCMSYAGLASKNFDHFAAQPGVSFEQQGGAGSMEAYSAGHQAACDLAKKEGMKKIDFAIVMNGCASHYLSDQFAPGHQTNPRRAIDKHANSLSGGSASIFKQFYSKWMHDEANQAGLTFRNAKGQTWRGYGDACNSMPQNKQNIEIHQAALTASAQAVLDLANDPTNADKYNACVADQQVKDLVPITAKLWDISELKANDDIMPMFYSDDGQTIKMRGDQKDICKTWGAHYDGFCNTQTDVYMGVDHGAKKDYPAAGPIDTCSNPTTGNTFPARAMSSPCEEHAPWSTGEGHLTGAKHPKCTPTKESTKAASKVANCDGCNVAMDTMTQYCEPWIGCVDKKDSGTNCGADNDCKSNKCEWHWFTQKTCS